MGKVHVHPLVLMFFLLMLRVRLKKTFSNILCLIVELERHCYNFEFQSWA